MSESAVHPYVKEGGECPGRPGSETIYQVPGMILGKILNFSEPQFFIK